MLSPSPSAHILFNKLRSNILFRRRIHFGLRPTFNYTLLGSNNFAKMTYNSKEEILRLGHPDHEFSTFLKNLNEPPVDHTDLAQRQKTAIERINMVTQRLAAGDPTTKKTKIVFPAADGTEQAAFLYQPSITKSDSPLIVMFHGGGFCLGAAEAEEQGCRMFVNAFGAVCLSVEYRLAPDHKFPTAPSDAWDALKFAASEAKSWGAFPERGFIVGGNSAGGNLAAMLSHKARDERLSPPLTGQFLSCPWLSSPDKVPEKYKHLSFSYLQNESVPVLPKKTLDAYYMNYLPDLNDDRFDILNYSTGHQNLPPAYFTVCGQDPFRDENLIYDTILREHGIPTKVDVFPGMPHGYWIFYPTYPGSNTARNLMLRGMGWLHGKALQ